MCQVSQLICESTKSLENWLILAFQSRRKPSKNICWILLRLVFQRLNSTPQEEAGTHEQNLLHEAVVAATIRKRALHWHLEAKPSKNPLKSPAAPPDRASLVKKRHRNKQDILPLLGIRTIEEKSIYPKVSTLVTQHSYNDCFNHVYATSIILNITN